MKKLSNIFWIVVIVLLCGIALFFYNAHKRDSEYKPFENATSNYDITNTPHVFSDGLPEPYSVTTYELDEFDIGISEKSVYYIDINNDGTKDRITRILNETGNAHSYYTYKLEINDNGKFIDITPDNLRTTNGASCDLQQIRFSFKPQFKITIISRELGETWIEPTMAYKQEFTLSENNKFQITNKNKIRPICDVKELF